LFAHHESLKGLDSLLGDFLVVKVFSQLTDHVNEIIIFGIELDDFDFDNFDIGFLIVVDEEFFDIFLKDIKMEFFDQVVNVFESDILNLW
jgi:hypothetical protein